MKMFKSIKWRLQIWYGLILVGVLLGLGITAYKLEHDKVFRHTDNELQRRVNVVLQTLHRGEQQRRPPPRPNDFDQPPGPPAGEFDRDRPPRGPEDFHLQPRDEVLFDAAAANGYYFVITGRDARVIARSTNAPTAVMYVEGPPATGKLNRFTAFPQLPDDRVKYGGGQFKYDQFPSNGVPAGQPFPCPDPWPCTTGPRESRRRNPGEGLRGPG